MSVTSHFYLGNVTYLSVTYRDYVDRGAAERRCSIPNFRLFRFSAKYTRAAQRRVRLLQLSFVPH
jgi:hypothetical protein